MTTLTMRDEKRLEIIHRVFRSELTVARAELVMGRSEPRGPNLYRVLKVSLHRPFKKISEARRASNRRAQAYLCSTLERGDGAQQSI